MQEIQNNSYFLLDSRGAPLARALLLSPQENPQWQVRVLDGKIEQVMEHEEIQMVPMGASGSALLGRIIRNRNDNIILEPLQALDSDMRQNLRMPTHFKSFIYPITGSWRGRREIEANDLSCGGIAFFCALPLEVEEQVEVVVPITSQPLLLRCRVLRQRPSARENEVLYAAKVVDMCGDEEMMVRESVFNIQLSTRPRPAEE